MHHINCIKNDNRIENLVIVSKKQHNKIHNKGVNYLIKELMKKGYIKFNREKLKYEVL